MFKVRDILRATGGKLVSGSKNSSVVSLSTDSRRIKRGEMFVCIVGKNYDGHGFIKDALKKGASAILTSKDIGPLPSKTIVLKVKNTQTALQDIARHHRLTFKLPVIGVTGSSGKTTTKDMIYSILSLEKKTLKNLGNLNNEIGVPLTLLNLDKSHKAAVIEMAMQRAGEIDELAKTSLPDIAVITNIGEAHMEYFRSKGKIAEVKAEIFNYMKGRGTAVINADDEYFAFLKRKAGRSKVLSFGLGDNPDVLATNIRKKGHSTICDLIFKNKTTEINIPLPGIHNIYNALAAAAVCLSLGIKVNTIKNGLKRFKPSDKRMNISEKRGIRVINDSYNANPSSMKAAISVLSDEGPVVGSYPPRRIAVLGDMLELGKISRPSHWETGRFAAEKGVDILVTKGHLSKEIAQGARSAGLRIVHTTSSNEEASKLLEKLLKQNDVVLIKGSRGMKMEEIAEKILK